MAEPVRQNSIANDVKTIRSKANMRLKLRKYINANNNHTQNLKEMKYRQIQTLQHILAIILLP
jgi:hypothetical protein